MQKELKWKQWKILCSLAPKSLLYGDCTHEIKMHLLCGRKVMTKLGSTFKTRNITLPTKVHIVKTMVFPAVRYGCESWTIKKTKCRRIVLSNCGAGEDSWESFGQQNPTSQSWRKSTLNIHWKDWCWSWRSSALAAWHEELTHGKRPWCWEWLKASGEEGSRGWDGQTASPTQWTWVWANSRRQWRAGKPGVLQSMGLQRLGHDLVTEQQ